MNRNTFVERLNRRFNYWAQRHPWQWWIGLAFLIFFLIMMKPTYGGPIENMTPIAGNLTNFSARSFEWGPETGLYTRWWFNTSKDLFDPFGFFYSLFLPIADMTGWGWMFFIMWGGIVTAYYLYSEESTLPFVIGILSGGVLSYAMGAEQIFAMTIVMVFLGGGVLAKLLLGRQ